MGKVISRESGFGGSVGPISRMVSMNRAREVLGDALKEKGIACDIDDVGDTLVIAVAAKHMKKARALVRKACAGEYFTADDISIVARPCAPATDANVSMSASEYARAATTRELGKRPPIYAPSENGETAAELGYDKYEAWNERERELWFVAMMHS